MGADGHGHRASPLTTGTDRKANGTSVARPRSPRDAVTVADALLADASAAGASDIHLAPEADRYDVRLRVDGLLRGHDVLDPALGRSVVTRLMVLARLLTYRLDVPQEGRASVPLPGRGPAEVRVAVMPTTHGLRCVVRLPCDLDAATAVPRTLESLELPPHVAGVVQAFLRAHAGLLLVVGPAGSGKTTTLHAVLSHLAQTRPELSLISVEDPVERDLPGVAQIEVTPFGELTFERALRSVLRQDPQVLMVGEIRDAETAALAVRAALSGHRLLCTTHASTVGGAVARLLEMGLEPYRLTSALHAVLNQRLLRRRSDAESGGYRGRVLAAEAATMTPALRRAILDRGDAEALQRAAASAGTPTIADHARRLVARGVTDEAEVERVLGLPEA